LGLLQDSGYIADSGRNGIAARPRGNRRSTLAALSGQRSAFSAQPVELVASRLDPEKRHEYWKS
jgi:hypothetical protein